MFCSLLYLTPYRIFTYFLNFAACPCVLMRCFHLCANYGFSFVTEIVSKVRIYLQSFWSLLPFVMVFSIIQLLMCPCELKMRVFEMTRLSTTCPPLPVPAHPSHAPSSMAVAFKLSLNIPVRRPQCFLDPLSYAETLGHPAICIASNNTPLSQSKRLSTILDVGPSTCRSVRPRSQRAV